MLIIPAPRFVEQDSTQPIPNLDPARLSGDVAILRLDFPMQPADYFYLSLNSTVLGGTHNQSFNIAHSTASLRILIPTNIVIASAGTEVQLRARILRGGLYSTAGEARVNIGRLPIVVPPDQSWDFSDGTFQGWVAQGVYVSRLSVIGSRVVVNQFNNQATSSHIITRAVPVTAGRTYNCSFEVTGSTAVSDGSTLHMTINGSRIGPDVTTITDARRQIGTGTFTAATTGTVRLGIFNATVPSGQHGLSLGPLQMSTTP
ncbi:hypothetical protein [Pseudomonas sp. 22 E 5]|jgi:hypothetical protein|uniref:Uncharacterized protein n=2 Tax=Pseudomonas TaxID=286 RepID=A0A4Y9TCS5_PSEFL|nr:hypothetical protein [Pseudomonas fluorescens]TFW40882.1 hypothetical protein E4T65_23825 [Pseudomonas fluorescens]CRM96334.1 hypothetical protein [Pseudomonas sp. 22 E 5]